VLLAAGTIACRSTPFDPAATYGIAEVRVVPDSAMINGEPSAFSTDGTVGLSIQLLGDSGQGMPLDIVPTWRSSDPSVATVSLYGIVVGRKAGTTTIEATVGSVHGYATITVVPASDTAITVAAHRGFKRVFPENTLVAIAGAYEKGADAAEIDVRLTLDRVPVVMHDPTVDRTTNGTGAVPFLTLKQIKQLDACSKFGSSWAPCEVPTLREALETAHGHGMLILDLEGPYDSAALVSVLKIVRSEGMERYVIITSFNYQLLVMVRELDEVIPLGILGSQMPAVQYVARLGRAIGMPDEESLFAAPAASSALVTSARTQNVDVMAWTVSTPEEARALVALGVRHIISDVPLDKTMLGEVAAESRPAHAIAP
jgi:glycerophosphoryl diester phosphodiesterase